MAFHCMKLASNEVSEYICSFYFCAKHRKTVSDNTTWHDMTCIYTTQHSVKTIQGDIITRIVVQLNVS